MREPLNKEKSDNLRPLRIILAILTVVLVILILDKLPTSRTYSGKLTEKNVLSADESSEKTDDFFLMTGFLDRLENDLEKRLEALGVPEEEYENIGEYLSKDELFEIETKATLASELEGNYCFATEDDLEKLREIFELSPSYPFDIYRAETAPKEYKNLSDLLETYQKTLTTVEDYDVVE